MQELGDILKKMPERSVSAGDTPPPPYEDDSDDGDVCGICGGKGWYTPEVPVGHRDFGRLIVCDCQQEKVKAERQARLLKYSNLGSLKRFTFEGMKPEGMGDDPVTRERFEVAYRAALDFADAPSGWLVFSGPHGSGKTHLAAAVGNRAIDRRHVVLFSHTPELVDHLRATFSPTSEEAYSDLFEQVRNTPLLILDDLGMASTTPWAEEKLQQIVNHRYNAELPTVFTTVGALADLDPYILTRLQASDLSQVFELASSAPEPVHRLGRVEPEMLKRMTLETFDVRGNNPRADQRGSLEEARRVAVNYAADPDGWLTFIGDTGVGKTHLAVAVAEAQLKNGREVFFAFVPELLDYLRYTFSPDSRITYDDLFDEVKNTPLLVLDDLGQEHSSPWANEKLYQIIVHRHAARLPTVVTSMVDFTREHGPIGSRVQDPSVGILIRVDAPDYRNKTRASARAGARSRR